MTVISPGKLLGLRRIADESGRFKMLAVDQRPPIEALVRDGRGSADAAFEDVAGVKEALITELSAHASATLLDPQYVFPAAIPKLPMGTGVIITLEDDTFTETADGRLSSSIPDWSVRKIQASGGDAVKVLAWYRPDASEKVKEHQKEFVAGIGVECTRLDIPFVFELLLYPFPSENSHTSDYVEDPAKKTDHVLESVETFADPSYGVDLFKLESPVPASSIAGQGQLPVDELSQAFASLDRAAARPWVMLSAGATSEAFYRILAHAFDAGASGYLAGRAIWWDACVSTFPDWNAMGEMLREESVAYMERINQLTDARALPWTDHPAFGEEGPRAPSAGSEFRSDYMGSG